MVCAGPFEIIDSLVIRSSPHLKAPTRLSTLKVLRAKKHTPIFFSFIVFTFELAFESFKECEGASISLQLLVAVIIDYCV